MTLSDCLPRTMNCCALGRHLLPDRAGGPGPSDRPRSDDGRGHQICEMRGSLMSCVTVPTVSAIIEWISRKNVP